MLKHFFVFAGPQGPAFLYGTGAAFNPPFNNFFTDIYKEIMQMFLKITQENP